MYENMANPMRYPEALKNKMKKGEMVWGQTHCRQYSIAHFRGGSWPITAEYQVVKCN